MAVGLSRQLDQITIDEVVEVLQNDPGAVARVLQVVNSAYYGMRKEITSLHRAVIGLGPGAVLSIVMSVGMADMKEDLHIVTASEYQRLVRHSVAVGYFARRIVSLTKLDTNIISEERDILNEAYTVGLMHDFGKIVLFHNFPEKAVQFYESVHENKDAVDADVNELLIQEKALFGIDHVQAGTFLMKELNLLSSIETAVTYHHNNEAVEGKEPDELYLLNTIIAGNKLANAAGFEYNRKISRKAFKEDPFWDTLIENQFFEQSDKTEIFREFYEMEEQARAYVSEHM